MRVLWITHDLFEVFLPFVKGKPTKGGSWIAPLFYSIQKKTNITLGSVTPVIGGKQQKQIIDDVTYYSVGIDKNENKTKMNKRLVNSYMSAIDDFKPDIVHVHGTENNFGLLRKYIDANIAVVCSIQGIITPCLDYLKQSVSSINIGKYRSIKNRMGRGGVNSSIRKWEKYSDIEKDIFKLNHYFIGRTTWDKACLMEFNEKAEFFHGEELLRSQFYSSSWSIDQCERYRIFVSSAAYPLKGFHVLLHALAILKKRYPHVKVVAPLSSIDQMSSRVKDFMMAEDYDNYIKSEIKKLKLEDNVIFQKKLSAGEMAIQYCKAHVFVLPSFIENSPNSLGESMMIGTPSVVAPVGGVISIVSDNESSLLFPCGDHASLALQIGRIFDDDNLAVKISNNAREIARRRHDVQKVTDQYLSIYSEIIKLHYESSTNTPRT
ncbi:glycosyltransferase family 4 protein [Proteiniphilum sp. UBA5431]|uniref:glycosyltransferase family 4 protein n=1 Tax=Proteiniphilum sp. UBA5431 TaxID=1947280 RepID=UPI00257F45E6|nr:glycosyltransferase family 4 protein [Proteiniphilum sp. UBA5431]